VNNLRELQIELSGLCNASCAYCDWNERKAGRQLMPLHLALSLLEQAQFFPGLLVTYHGVGESTMNPVLGTVVARGEHLGLRQRLSTNCYLLDRWMDLSQVKGLDMILALHWGLSPKFIERCVDNATAYLCTKPANRSIEVMTVCSVEQERFVPRMLDEFLPLVERLPNVCLHFKQPQTWPRCQPQHGRIPSVPAHPRIVVESLMTPVSLGRGCTMPEYLLQVMADGTVAPCCVGTEDWGLPKATDTPLADIWASERMADIRRLWRQRDDSILCGHCLKREDC
jgi:Iron-sulfur cluster-binding domain